jgi:hypothetical protein
MSDSAPTVIAEFDPSLPTDAEQFARLTAENTRLRAALEAWMDAVVIDVTMEGPRYMGVSSTLGRKAWENTLAVFTEEPRT